MGGRNMTYRGRVENGVVVFDSPVNLPEGASVDVILAPQTRRESSEGPTLLERLQPVLGTAQNLPADAAANVDHYLYGHPRR